jgi:6-phosphogluconate dehydrogenase
MQVGMIGLGRMGANMVRRLLKLGTFAGRVSDSGAGPWMIKAAIDEGVPVPVLGTSLSNRFSSQGHAEFKNKLVSAIRYSFGGHVEQR